MSLTGTRPFSVMISRGKQVEITGLGKAIPQKVLWVPKRCKSDSSTTSGKGKEVEERVGAKGGTEGEKDESNFGYDPPLYNGKPPFWARWVFVLLAIDVLFT